MVGLISRPIDPVRNLFACTPVGVKLPAYKAGLLGTCRSPWLIIVS